MPWNIYLHIGESFAEILAKQTDKSVMKRWYLPQSGISQGIQSFLTEHQIADISAVKISSRYLQKVFDRKLGGSVACITTRGFEHWTWLRQPLLQNNFELFPQRHHSLSNAELIFGISERTLASGTIDNKPAESELEFLASKLKMMDVKRVCINFLHALKNPQNEVFVGQYFKEKGFQVFLSHQIAYEKDEVHRWRHNILNASLTGMMSDLFDELKKVFANQFERNQIHIVNSSGELFLNDDNQFASSVFGHLNSIQSATTDKSDLILYLGLEKFIYIKPRHYSDTWQSPWGAIHLKSLQFENANVQPSQSIDIDPLDQSLRISDTEVGFEPGPMFLGRGQKPTFLDCLAFNEKLKNISGVESHPQFENRFSGTFLALQKISSDKTENAKNHSMQIINTSIHRMFLEASLRHDLNRVVLTGCLAKTLEPIIKKAFVGVNIVTDNLYEWRETEGLI